MKTNYEKGESKSVASAGNLKMLGSSFGSQNSRLLIYLLGCLVVHSVLVNQRFCMQRRPSSQAASALGIPKLYIGSRNGNLQRGSQPPL